MTIPSHNSIDHYILLNKILCDTMGMWPFDDEPSTWKAAISRLRYGLYVMTVNTIFVPELMLIVVNWGDIKILTGVGCIMTTLAQFMLEMIYLTVTKEKSFRLYKELRSLWDSSDNPEERRCYENMAYWARTCTAVYYLFAVLTVINFTISAIIDYINDDQMANSTLSRRHLPFDVWYGKDISGSPEFEIAFAFQILAALLACTGICGLHTMCMTTILHLSGQFRLISKWISNIGIEVDGGTNYLEKWSPSLTTRLIRCIRHHQRLIHVVSDVNSLLTPIIFMQIVTSAIEICLSGFAIISNREAGDSFKFITYLSATMIQLLSWCWPGEILVQESQNLAHVIYSNIPWYELPPVYQRQLLLMILRSQKYCSISALTFQTLSINSLTTVFNTAASYFTLLRQMEE